MAKSAHMVMIDGNTAAAHVAHACSEVIAIYPITPSSPMGELSDEYSAMGRKNLWGTIPQVVEMQSEAGAAGAVHGALTTGALSTTFTASQGLLLMIPNMFKIAGEASSTVFHIAARAVAAQGLSIFGDHQDVMAARQTGWAMLASNNVQEVMDTALIAHSATLKSRVPFLHFFDGFRTSHEVQKVEELSYELMGKMIPDALVRAHRARGLSPERPSIRGTSQNPDVYFASRESANKYMNAVPALVQKTMDEFAALTGRQYKLFDYSGAPDADKVIVVMGSGADTVEEIVEHLVAKGEKVGVLKVRLYRPFSFAHFVNAMPPSTKSIAVLDRTKEPGAVGEPMYEDVRTAIGEAMGAGKSHFKSWPTVIGGRYGLGSYEFTPAMVKAVFKNLAAKAPKNHFTVGINDDVTNSSIPVEDFHLNSPGVVQCLFYGLGSDGTVGANKNSIKIIGDETPNSAQGYFVYDSKKAGTYTISHLRFGPKLIKKPYLIAKADFLACHKFSFVEKLDMLANAKDGGVFLLNSPFPADKVWDELPLEVQKRIIDKKLRFYVIDAMALAEEADMGTRINTIMQTAFFKISGVLPEDEAVKLIKKYTEKTYIRKGADVVAKNIAAIDLALTATHQVTIGKADSTLRMLSPVPASAPKFVKEVLGEIIAARGDSIPVSKLPDDGTFPVGTTKYEKRNIAEKIPVWNPELCIQCGQCSLVCPHAVIRLKAYEPAAAKGAPSTFKSVDAKGKELAGLKATLQIAPEDCTGCGACVNICPARDKTNPELKAINLEPQPPLRETEKKNWDFFLAIPDTPAKYLNLSLAKGVAMRRPLFEFSGACAGCGETPYIKLMSQLFGDRAVIANATGCSSIYGGNLPTTPYTVGADGRGPAWSNSLFEDAAEFGMGMRLTVEKHAEYARELLADALGKKLVDAALAKRILANTMDTDEAIETQRVDVAALKKALKASKAGWAAELNNLSDGLLRKSVWIFGGDGWAYDIGFGGLDHVIAANHNVNILVMDTEVYSNTGGQASKATPIGAIAKFATAGKETGKKDLGMIAVSYGYVYVAQIAMGANQSQTIRAFREAESFNGPSLIIAYSHCINQGIDMMRGMNQQKIAVESGVWPLYRYDPRLKAEGKNPFQLDSKEPDFTKLDEYMYKEVRFKSLREANPERAASLLEKQRAMIERKYKEYRYLADRPF